MITEQQFAAEEFPAILQHFRAVAEYVNSIIDDCPNRPYDCPKWAILDAMQCDLYNDIIDPLAEIVSVGQRRRRAKFINR